MGLWLATLLDGFTLPTAFDPAVWHAREMLFGFAGAAVAGYMLTLIPNWTGRYPLQGLPLVALLGLWVAGRLAVATSAVLGAMPAMLVDLALPALLLAASAREVITGRNWRNLPVLGALGLLLLASTLTHLDAMDVAATAQSGIRIGIATLLGLIGLVGGRLLPSFTHNRLARLGQTAMPAPFGPVDRLGFGLLAAALAAWALAPDRTATALLAIAAGIATAWRQSRWRPWRVGTEPILLAMHLAYAWLALGLIGLGLSPLADLSRSLALHAWGLGAVGTMILAVMSRTSLAHTGRVPVGRAGTTTACLVLTLATVLRITAELAPDIYLPVLFAAGSLWIVAFSLFVFIHAPILAAERSSGR